MNKINFLDLQDRAGDTFTVWGALADQAQIEMDFSEALKTREMMTAHAKHFGKWIDQHRNKLDELEILDLDKKNLSSIPDELWQLINLRTLSLSSNFLPEISVKVKSLKNLILLNLNENGLKKIPEEIGELKELRYLHLKKNQLESIPKALGNARKICALDLSENKLKSIPKQVLALPNLKEINTRGNPIAQ